MKNLGEFWLWVSAIVAGAMMLAIGVAFVWSIFQVVR